MIQVSCPICDRAVKGASRAELPYLPFCSERCKTIDLGRWLGEKYRITVPTENSSVEERIDDEEFP
jgi:hypothetical protein